MKARPLLTLLLAGGILALAICGPGLAQMARPPSGGVDNRFLAPPSGVQQSFLGTWNLTWDDPGDPNCPCHGTLTVDTQADGSLKGYWSIKNPPVILLGEVDAVRALDEAAGSYLAPRAVPPFQRGWSQFEGSGRISATTMPTVMIGTCATTSACGFMTLVGP